MQPYSTIVAAVDLTERSENALLEAVRLAGAGASVKIVHIVEALALSDLVEVMPGGTPVAGLERLEQDVLADARRRLQVMVDSIADEHGRIQFEAAIGQPAEMLLERANALKADLLVMARNSTSDPASGAGSNAVRCVRHAAMDVLLVRDSHVGPYRSILVCVDFSQHSHAAAQRAADIARLDGAALHLVHAFRPPWEVVPFAAVPMAASGDYQTEHMHMLENQLRELEQAIAASHPNVPIHRHLEPAGSVGSTLVCTADSLNVDLTVLGSHGRGRIERLLLGSTAERVIRSATCSVLTVKHVPDEIEQPEAVK